MAVAYRLGINTSFAVKRWPEPERWAEIVDELGVSLVQHNFDLVDLDGPEDFVSFQAEAVRAACESMSLQLHSTFTGLAAYSFNLLLHPNRRYRERAEDWYRRAIDFTVEAGAPFTGGHLGAFSISSWESERQRNALNKELEGSLLRLTRYARSRGLQGFLVENMAAAREPSTMEWMRRLTRPADDDHVGVGLCLDVGHQVVRGTEGAERDPYAWLEQLGALAPVVHLQQSDEEADHHWPFTDEKNAQGRVRADKVLDALDGSGAREVALVIEVVPAFEEPDDAVMEGIRASVHYWKAALQDRA